MGFRILTFFHLLTHAIFKSLLFLCAGSIIHNINNFQDIRYIGCLGLKIILTSIFFNIANLALCGIPFLAGFYSKDLILELVTFSNLNLFIYLLFYFSTGLTVIYSFRLIYYSIIWEYSNLCVGLVNNEDWLILQRIFILVIISVVRGSIILWLIFPSPYIVCLSLTDKLIILLVCLFGGLIGYFIYFIKLIFDRKLIFNFINIIWLLGQIWFLPIISSLLIMKPFFYVGGLIKFIDHGWSELFGSINMYKFLKFFFLMFHLLYSNKLKIYIFMFFFILIL